jgi:transcription initiation factor TFIIF subunit beta
MSDSKTPSTTPSKEKKSSDKDLDLTNASRGVWLVKIPKYMADRWETIDTPATVGKLTISRRPGQKPVVSFSLDDKVAAGSAEEDDKSSHDKTPKDKSGNDSEAKVSKDKLPKEHKFNVTTVQGHSLAVFSHLAGDPDASTPIPDKLCLEGKVVQRAECRPIQVKP